jgi:hypothetical protein
MALIASDTGGGGDFKPVPPGNHIAVCCAVVDLGRQEVKSEMYGSSIKHQVYIQWELPQEPLEWTDKDGNEQKGFMRIGKTYTVSLHENANLRADLENWRGRAFTRDELDGFDLTTIAGVPAMVNVVHKVNGQKTYANVTGVTPLPKGMERPALSDGAMIYDDEHLSSFNLLPEWLQKKVQGQIVEQKTTNADLSELDDDIPF